MAKRNHNIYFFDKFFIKLLEEFSWNFHLPSIASSSSSEILRTFTATSLPSNLALYTVYKKFLRIFQKFKKSKNSEKNRKTFIILFGIFWNFLRIFFYLHQIDQNQVDWLDQLPNFWREYPICYD